MKASVALLSASLLGAAECIGTEPVQAGPCSTDIAQFEQAVRASTGNPNAGPVAPQSVSAQIDRQPTPASIRRAQQHAQAAFATALAQAKKLDGRGDRACVKALAEAKGMYLLP